jgi:hypothetical protein
MESSPRQLDLVRMLVFAHLVSDVVVKRIACMCRVHKLFDTTRSRLRSPFPRAFVLCRRCRCTGPPFDWVSPRCLPPLALVLLCVAVRLQPAGVLSGAWYGFAVAPRRTSSGHALHVCATGAVASCAPRWCALGETRSGLAVWVVGPHWSGAAKTAGSAPFLAAARRRLGGGR